MHTDIAGDAFKFFSQRQQLGKLFLVLCAFVDLRFLLARLGQRDPQFVGYQLDEFVDEQVRQIKHAPDIAQHRLRRHGAKGGNLRHRLMAVAVLHILDHTVTAILTKVDIEVRHRHPFRVEEALEQQVIFQRVEIGNRQAVCHQRAGTGTTPRPHRHAIVFGPVDEVRHDQEIAREAHLNDGTELELQPFQVFRQSGSAGCLVGIQGRHALLQAFV